MGFYSTGFSHFLDEVSSIFQHLSFFIFNRAKKTSKMCTPIVRSLQWLGIHICAHISYFILVGLMLELIGEPVNLHENMKRFPFTGSVPHLYRGRKHQSNYLRDTKAKNVSAFAQIVHVHLNFRDIKSRKVEIHRIFYFYKSWFTNVNKMSIKRHYK